MKRKKTVLAIIGAIMALLPCNADNYHNPVIPSGAPDPTVIEANDGYFYLYATEDLRNVPIYRSKNLVDWKFVGTAFTDGTRPTFVKNGGIWAPDINYINGKYVLYYAMSTWGGEWEAGIGVATSDSPAGPFKDLGPLFTSRQIGVQNSIDGFYMEDDGRKYLFWGSFHGIYGIELSDDGLKIKEGSLPRQIAGTFMEATLIIKRKGYYYLLGSAGTCCEGDKSTYRVTVGRSRNLFGPYVDKKGQPLMDNHYEVILHKSDFVVGPGHNSEIITDKKGQYWMLYHGFLKDDPDRGRCVFLDQMLWKNGWPYFQDSAPSKTHKCPYFGKN